LYLFSIRSYLTATAKAAGQQADRNTKQSIDAGEYFDGMKIIFSIFD
jgi:hypothetical protein